MWIEDGHLAVILGVTDICVDRGWSSCCDSWCGLTSVWIEDGHLAAILGVD